MKEITLTKGQVAIVDDSDYEYLNQWKWCAKHAKQTFYAERNEWNSGVITRIRMHRLILKPLKGEIVDHIDRNGLNNQRNNLRIATSAQNAANKKALGTSKYLGVCLAQRKYRKKNGSLSIIKYWQASIQYGKKFQFLGYFETEEEAALRYNEAAKEAYGEFANLNIVNSKNLLNKLINQKSELWKS